MESWSNTTNERDAYIQWIEYSLLRNVREMTPVHHECTHIADWTANEWEKVALKQIITVDIQLFDFHQVIISARKIMQVASCNHSNNCI